MDRLRYFLLCQALCHSFHKIQHYNIDIAQQNLYGLNILATATIYHYLLFENLNLFLEMYILLFHPILGLLL
nr:MAG TPA: hypothetical protein [Caudoviricetes sp.]